MRLLRGAVLLVGGAIGLLAGLDGTREAGAQLGIPPYSRAPPSVFSNHPYHPEFCDLFHRGPCFPDYLPPIGQDLRLTIISTDDDRPAGNNGDGNSDKNGDDTKNDAAGDKDDRPLDSIGEMYAALRGCWVPPPKDVARHGMEYTIRFAFKRDGEMMAPPRVTYATHGVPSDTRGVYRDAVDAALARCTPLHFSAGMGGAVAGRPIAIRFVDERSTEKPKSVQ